ncbi:MAG: hypothetical protein ACT4RN_21225 [Pseudonocardia sp.]
MTTATAATGDFTGVLTDIRLGVDEAAGIVNAIISAIDGVLRASAGFLVGGLVDAVEELGRLFNSAVAQLGEILSYAGDPDALRAAGQVWADQIGGAASRLAGTATLDGVRADDHWSGVAADAYRNTLRPQQEALTTIKTVTDELDTTLNDLANAIFGFAVQVAAAALVLVAALAAASVIAAGVVTAPVAAALAAAAITAFGAFLTTVVLSLHDTAQTAATNAAALERRVSNDAAFPRSDWPRSTTGISSDGSITDGDDTDWHLR